MPYLKNRLTFVWLLLTIVTLLAWWVGWQSGGHSPQANLAVSVVVLVLAFAKTRFVIRDFMEVRSAPAWLQRTCDGWLVGLLAMILAFFWFT